MKLFKEYKFIPYFIIYLLSSTLFLTILNLTIGLNNKANEIISLILISFYCLIFGIKKTINSNNKYLLSSIKYGLIHIFTLYFFGSLLDTFSLTLQKIIYYFIILSILLLGTIIGIKLKKE